MTMPERLEFMRALQAGHAQRFKDGFQHWNVIEAVIELFIANDMGAPGTWASYVDAGIVEGIERGVAIASGIGQDDYGNPGARLWARYLTGLRAGRLDDKALHNRSWSIAEQASTEWGAHPANNPRLPTLAEATLFAASEVYRRTLRYEPAIKVVLRTVNAPHLTRCHDWLTDTTNRRPIRVGGQFFVTLSRTPTDVRAVTGALTRLASLYPECTRGARHPV